jgi:hypothetical protein
MFLICKMGDWRGVGGSEFHRFVADGLPAVEFREKHGLPSATNGRVRVLVKCNDLADRGAAQSWSAALDSNADLPLVSIGRDGSPTEFGDLVADGVLVPSGPHKFEDGTPSDRVGLAFDLACSPRELVAWRRAWAAEQRAKAAEKEAAKLKRLLEEAEEAEETE